MRVALIAHSAPRGDAIGNQVAARAGFFRERAADVRVYVESDARLHPDLLPITQVVNTPTELDAILADLRHCDLIVVDYSQNFQLLELIPSAAGRGPRIVFDYHGVTPPEFWSVPETNQRSSRVQPPLPPPSRGGQGGVARETIRRLGVAQVSLKPSVKVNSAAGWSGSPTRRWFTANS